MRSFAGFGHRQPARHEAIPSGPTLQVVVSEFAHPRRPPDALDAGSAVGVGSRNAVAVCEGVRSGQSEFERLLVGDILLEKLAVLR